LASTWITSQHRRCHRSMEKEGDRPQSGSGDPGSRCWARNIRPHDHEGGSVAIRAHLSCWAFWSGTGVIHIQGAIS
jgi:hypothetical protein